MPIEESQLGNHPLAGGSVILEDEACPKCDYNLKGLRRGGVCPECGRGISARKRGKRALMIDAPRGYLRGLMLVFLMMGWAGIGAFLIAVVPMIVFSLPILRATGLASVLSVVAMVGALGGSMSWSLGAVLLCRTRPGFTESNPEDRRLVRWILLTQPMWPVAFVLAGVGLMTGAGALDYAAYSCAFVAALGLVPTALRLAEFADWADDLNLGMQLRTVGWMLGGCAVVDGVHKLAVVTDFALMFLVTIFWIFALLGMAVGWFLLSWRCVQLAGVTRWAILNAKDADARAARLAEKAEQERQEQNRKVEAQRGALGSDPSATRDLPVRLEKDSDMGRAAAPETPDDSGDGGSIFRLEGD